jgi:hypothetical protein
MNIVTALTDTLTILATATREVMTQKLGLEGLQNLNLFDLANFLELT